MVGRQIEGWVRRSVLDGLQCVIVQVTGTVSTLDEVYTALKSDCWKVAKRQEIVCTYTDFIHQQFSIVQSERGAVSGAHSDSKNDNKSGSLSSSSKSGRSSNK